MELDALAVTVSGAEPDIGVMVRAATGAVGGNAPEIVRVRDAEPVPPPLEAVNVTLKMPVAAGIPEINPLTVLIDNPEGRPNAL